MVRALTCEYEVVRLVNIRLSEAMVEAEWHSRLCWKTLPDGPASPEGYCHGAFHRHACCERRANWEGCAAYTHSDDSLCESAVYVAGIGVDSRREG